MNGTSSDYACRGRARPSSAGGFHGTAERLPIHDFIRRTVSNEAKAFYTDELRFYIDIETPENVRHSADEWGSRGYSH